MPFNIVYDHIRSFVEDFNPVRVMDKKGLVGPVHRESHIASGCMPVRIYQGGYRLISLCVKLLSGAVSEDICSSEFGAHMHQHFFRVTVAERVAVHAVAPALGVSVNRCLAE